MQPSDERVSDLVSELRRRGYAHVAGLLEREDYDALAAAIGDVVGEERIALRPGAHAYVAKAGPVPLHTDQPEVQIISWWCERQDECDGASLLLDSRPVIEALSDELRCALRDVHLMTPALRGGPPTISWPVLRSVGEDDAIFCSPWLRSAVANPRHDEALSTFRKTLSDAICARKVSVRLATGDALFVDNQRVLHGRSAIAQDSHRCLRRKWIVDTHLAADDARDRCLGRTSV
jgi:hypothetical protein